MFIPGTVDRIGGMRIDLIAPAMPAGILTDAEASGAMS